MTHGNQPTATFCDFMMSCYWLGYIACLKTHVSRWMLRLSIVWSYLNDCVFVKWLHHIMIANPRMKRYDAHNHIMLGCLDLESQCFVTVGDIAMSDTCKQISARLWIDESDKNEIHAFTSIRPIQKRRATSPTGLPQTSTSDCKTMHIEVKGHQASSNSTR